MKLKTIISRGLFNSIFGIWVLFFSSQTLAQTTPTLPPLGQTLVLIGQEYPTSYESYIAATNAIVPAGASVYATWGSPPALQSPDNVLVPYVGTNYPCSYVEIGLSWDSFAGANQVDFENAVAAGTYDSDIQTIATWMTAYPNVTFLLRIGYEVNPPLEGANNYATPYNYTAYGEAFHHIKTQLKADGATNFLAVFHTQVGWLSEYYGSGLGTPNLYPDTTGTDTDVDVVGWSIWPEEFGLGDTGWGGVATTTDTFGETIETGLLDDIQYMQTNHPNKPLMICESTCADPWSSTTANFEEFLNDYFTFIQNYNFRAFVYIDNWWNSPGGTEGSWPEPYGDARLEANSNGGTNASQVLSYWQNIVNNGSRYINYVNCLVTTTPTNTATSTVTSTATNTATFTATDTSTSTVTNTMTGTATNTATNTTINTFTNTATNTSTNTPTATPTDTSTNTATNTGTNTLTNTSTNTSTSTPTATATNTLVNTSTNTSTNTETQTATATSTNTSTHTPTNTVTKTSTTTPTVTFTNTLTSTPTVIFTKTMTPTATVIPTSTVTSTPTVLIHVWPNPFNPQTAVGGTFRISGMNNQTTVSLFTVSGELIETLNSQNAVCSVADTWGMTYCWNGRNKMGVAVSTGIYLYVIQQGNQTIQEGKFLVVNGF